MITFFLLVATSDNNVSKPSDHASLSDSKELCWYVAAAKFVSFIQFDEHNFHRFNILYLFVMNFEMEWFFVSTIFED